MHFTDRLIGVIMINVAIPCFSFNERQQSQHPANSNLNITSVSLAYENC